MIATDILRQEHDLILKVLDIAEAEAHLIAQSGQVRSVRIQEMVDFFREYADFCHHAKEEKLLFVTLENYGLTPDAGPIAVMLHEHDAGRKYVAEIIMGLKDEGSDVNVRQRLSQSMQSFVELLRSHILKENEVLFPMADRMINERDQEFLAMEFRKLEAGAEIGGRKEKQREIALRLLSA